MIFVWFFLNISKVLWSRQERLAVEPRSLNVWCVVRLFLCFCSVWMSEDSRVSLFRLLLFLFASAKLTVDFCNALFILWRRQISNFSLTFVSLLTSQYVFIWRHMFCISYRFLCLSSFASFLQLNALSSIVSLVVVRLFRDFLFTADLAQNIRQPCRGRCS